MKRPRVLAIVPLAPKEGVCDHVATYLTRCREDPRYAVDLEYPCAVPSEVARTIGLKTFLEGGYDWLLSIDSDNPPGRHALDLIELDLPLIGLPTPVHQHTSKGKPTLVWNAYRRRATRYESIVPDTWELEEVDAFGTGCYLAAARVFHPVAMRRQPYGRVWKIDGTVKLGSDLAFCERARAAGFPLWVHWGYRCNHFCTVNLAEMMQIRLDAWNAGHAVGMRKGRDSDVPRVLNVGSRAECLREGRSCVKKIFSTGEAGKIAFANEQQADRAFRSFPWFNPWLEHGDDWFVNSRLPLGSRLKESAPAMSDEERKGVAGQALSIILDMLVSGYAHRDFHVKNAFLVGGQLKLMDFECLAQYDEGNRPVLSGCYDVTGKGLDSPWAAGNMCYTQENCNSLSTALRVNFQEAKLQLASILKRELREASLTFKARQGRHRCSQGKTYSAFSLPGLVVNPEDAQRDCAKRLKKFGGSDLVDGKSVLDLGSNVGGMLFEAQRSNPAACVGFEYDECKVRVANRVAAFCDLKNVEFKQGDVDALDDLDLQYDVVMCLALEAHVNDKKHLYRLLGNITRETLLFEGNSTTDVREVEAELKKIGFSRIENLGVCDDDSRQENNCRPLLRAFK